MWETVQDGGMRLSHDRPCADCGHARHTFLACSDSCTCQPALAPGARDDRFATA